LNSRLSSQTLQSNPQDNHPRVIPSDQGGEEPSCLSINMGGNPQDPPSDTNVAVVPYHVEVGAAPAEYDTKTISPGPRRFPGFSPTKSLKTSKEEGEDGDDEWSQRKQKAQEIADTVIEEVGREMGLCVDAKWYGNVGRFINHSCDPNLCKQTVFVETHDARMPRLAFFALWDIPAMEELTYDYGYMADSVEGKQMICRCGAQNCRGRMY